MTYEWQRRLVQGEVGRTTSINVIYRVALQFLFLLTVKGIRFATGFHENWNLELCNLTYKSGYLQILF